MANGIREPESVGYAVAAGMRYVRQAVGDEGARLVAERCGLGRTVAELLDEDTWYAPSEVGLVADAAKVLCGDEAIGWKAGAELFRHHGKNGRDEALRAAGSPTRAFVDLVADSSKPTGDRQIALVEVGERGVLIEAKGPEHGSSRYVCQLDAGYWAQVPALFGATRTTVIEQTCRARGDATCRFRIRWEPAAGRGATGLRPGGSATSGTGTDALVGASRTLAQLSGVQDVCSGLATALTESLGCQASTVWRWDAGGTLLTRVAWAGLEPSSSQPTLLTAFDLASFAPNEGSASATVVDVGTAPVSLAVHLRDAGIDQLGVAPIVARKTALGYVMAAFSKGRPAGPDTAGTLQAIADIGGLALDNALLIDRLNGQALHDALTGLPNRALLEDRADRAMRRAERSGSSVGLLHVDIDRFKRINDTFGRRTGDELLCQVAARLLARTRAEDTLARLVGDEFVVLLPSILNHEAAETVASKVLAALTEPFIVEGYSLNVSSSVGIALYPQEGGDFESLMHHADAAMNRAKSAGGDGFASALLGSRRSRNGH